MVAKDTDDMDKVAQKSSPRVSSVTPLEERKKNHQHQGDIGKEKSAGQSTPHVESVNTSLINKPDDDEGPKVEYATPVDELKAIAKAKLGHDLPQEDLRWILDRLELQGISREEYLVEVRKHVGNRWNNPVGFLKSIAKGFRSKLKPSSPPVTKVEFEERNYRCPKCKSTTRGEGTHLVAGKWAPCECASEEYIERLKAKGLIAHSEVTFQVPQAPPSHAISDSWGAHHGD